MDTLHLEALSLLPESVNLDEVVDYRHARTSWDGTPPYYDLCSIIYLKGTWWSLWRRRKVKIKIPSDSEELHDALGMIVMAVILANTKKRFRL